MHLRYKINQNLHDIYYLNNSLNQISKDLEKLKSDKKILFIYDKEISKNLKNKIYSTLKFSGCKLFQLEFRGSKKNKELNSALKIIDFMISQGFTKKSVILSMGGGVIGDLSAFAASLYMRGMIYFHIPSTMTSIIDSCIGGKTGVNYQKIINSIGTYYHADKVYILEDLIKSLPDREFYSGIPEILKCGIIKNKSLLNFLVNHHSEIKKRKTNFIKKLCFESLKTKINFFKDDVYENDKRLILNFGHTFAHAIEMSLEKNLNKKLEILRHGEAVGIGMICEIKYASELKENEVYRLAKKVLKIYDLPTNLKYLNLDKTRFQNDIFKFLFLDKKRVNRHPRYIQLKKFGKPKINEMRDYEKINFIINDIL